MKITNRVSERQGLTLFLSDLYCSYIGR